MNLTIQGTYKNGIITPDAMPAGIEEARVEIRFLTSDKPAKRVRGFLKFGMYRKDGSRLSTWEDFVDAKKMWEPKDH